MLRKALDSVAAQTYVDWEAVVFDVAASEEARLVASQYDSRVKYFAGRSEGPSDARNRGLSESCGEYILFLDDDDELLPDCLSVLVGQLKSDPTVGVSYGWHAWLTTQGRITSKPGPRIDNVDPQALPDGRLLQPCGFLHEGEVFSDLICEETLLLGDALIRRSWVTEVCGFDPSIAYQEHWDFYLRLAQAGCRFAPCRRLVSLHRLHDNNRGRRHDLMLTFRLQVLDRIFASDRIAATFKTIKDQAYFNAYEELLPLAYSGRPESVSGAEFESVLLLAPAGSRRHQLLVRRFATVLSKELEAKAPEFVAEQLSESSLGLNSRRFLREVKSRLHNLLARQASMSGEPSARVWKHGFAALRTYPPSVFSAEFRAFAIQQLFSANLRDSIRSRRLWLHNPLVDESSDAECIFVSPHFDDVALSCGGTLVACQQSGRPTTLVTVFSETGPHRSSDRAVAAQAGVDVRYLGFSDVLFRARDIRCKRGLFSSEILTEDESTFRALLVRFRNLVENHPGCYVIAPLGIGAHRDHVLVFEAVRKMSRDLGYADRVFYYEDFPYAVNSNVWRFVRELPIRLRPSSVAIDDTLGERIALAKRYSSQVSALLGDNVSAERAITRYAVLSGTRGQARERFWSESPRWWRRSA